MQFNRGSPGFGVTEAIIVVAIILFIAASLMAHWHPLLWLVAVLILLSIGSPVFFAWGIHVFKKQKPDITNYHNPANRRTINYLAEQTIAKTDFGTIIPPELVRCVEITFSDGHRLAIREQCGYESENGCFRSFPVIAKGAIPISGERDTWHKTSLPQFRSDISLRIWRGEEEVRIDCYGITKSIHRTGSLALHTINLPQ